MTNPLAYELEQAYHVRRQASAAHLRLIAEAERRNAAPSSSPLAALASRLTARLRWSPVRARLVPARGRR